LYNHYMKSNFQVGGQRVTNLVVKNGSNQPGRHNDPPSPYLDPSRDQSIYLSNLPADKCYQLRSFQLTAPTNAKGRWLC
jgi:hypothetical protein